MVLLASPYQIVPLHQLVLRAEHRQWVGKCWHESVRAISFEATGSILFVPAALPLDHLPPQEGIAHLSCFRPAVVTAGVLGVVMARVNAGRVCMLEEGSHTLCKRGTEPWQRVGVLVKHYDWLAAA